MKTQIQINDLKTVIETYSHKAIYLIRKNIIKLKLLFILNT